MIKNSKISLSISLSFFLLVGCSVSNTSSPILKDINTPKKEVFENKLEINKFTNTVSTPTIEFSSNNFNSKKAFKIGDELSLIVKTIPGIKVLVSFPGISDRKIFTETSPGYYELSYTIDEKVDEIADVKYTLINKDDEVTYLDNFGKVTFDNTPPSLPQVTYTILDNNVTMILENIYGDDIDLYVVEGLMDGEYNVLASSVVSKERENKLNFDINQDEELYIKAYFVDNAKNKSKNIVPIKISNYSDNTRNKLLIQKLEF